MQLYALNEIFIKNMKILGLVGVGLKKNLLRLENSSYDCNYGVLGGWLPLLKFQWITYWDQM